MLPLGIVLLEFSFLWHVSHTPGVFAQWTIPPEWQSIDSNEDTRLTKTGREVQASAAARTLVDSIDPTTGSISDLDAATTASLTAVLAIQDYYSGNRTWKDQVLLGTLSNYSALHPTYPLSNPYGTWSPDTLHFGLAAYYAYRTYNDATVLRLAVENWQLAYADFVTTERAQSGTFNGASNFTTICPTKLAGGVFTRPPTATIAEMALDSTSMMISLSGYLYNETRNATYLTTAQLAREFVRSTAYRPGHPIPAGINASDCTILDSSIFTWNTGLYLQGEALLASITENNSSYMAIVEDLVQLAETTSWTNLNDGVITEFYPVPSSSPMLPTANAYKGFYVRALAETVRLHPTTPVAGFIRAYINTQLYAVTRMASTNGTDFYSAEWTGPPATSFDAIGSIAALDVLNPAFGIASDFTNATKTTTTTATTGTSRLKPATVGGLVGGVVGGIACCTILVLVLLCMRNRRKRQKPSRTPFDPLAEYARMQELMLDPFPFTLDHPIVHLPEADSMMSHVNDTAIPVPARPRSPPAPIGEVTADAFIRQVADRGARDEVEAALSDFANRIQAVLRLRRRESLTESLPPPYTG